MGAVWQAPSLVSCQALPCTDAHKVAGCRILGSPGASAGSVLSRVRVWKTLGLLFYSLAVEANPGISARLLSPGVWPQGPETPGLISDHCTGEKGGFLTLLGIGSGCLTGCFGLLIGLRCPSTVLADYWVGQDLGANYPKCQLPQQQCSHGWKFPNMSNTSVYVPRVTCGLPSCPCSRRLSKTSR